MKGTHTVVVERAKVKYTLTFKRNISFIRGNSGTGKTTLISMIRDYNDRGPESGVTLSCDVPCETLSGRRWERELSIIEDTIIFLDEGNEFIYSKDFAKAVNGSSNYFVLISRRDASELPPSVLLYLACLALRHLQSYLSCYARFYLYRFFLYRSSLLLNFFQSYFSLNFSSNHS